jgi:hypothetical protein
MTVSEPSPAIASRSRRLPLGVRNWRPRTKSSLSRMEMFARAHPREVARWASLPPRLQRPYPRLSATVRPRYSCAQRTIGAAYNRRHIYAHSMISRSVVHSEPARKGTGVQRPTTRRPLPRSNERWPSQYSRSSASRAKEHSSRHVWLGIEVASTRHSARDACAGIWFDPRRGSLATPRSPAVPVRTGVLTDHDALWWQVRPLRHSIFAGPTKS